jgi:hypothetical protein
VVIRYNGKKLNIAQNDGKRRLLCVWIRMKLPGDKTAEVKGVEDVGPRVGS